MKNHHFAIIAVIVAAIGGFWYYKTQNPGLFSTVTADTAD